MRLRPSLPYQYPTFYVSQLKPVFIIPLLQCTCTLLTSVYLQKLFMPPMFILPATMPFPITVFLFQHHQPLEPCRLSGWMAWSHCGDPGLFSDLSCLYVLSSLPTPNSNTFVLIYSTCLGLSSAFGSTSDSLQQLQSASEENINSDSVSHQLANKQRRDT